MKSNAESFHKLEIISKCKILTQFYNQILHFLQEKELKWILYRIFQVEAMLLLQMDTEHWKLNFNITERAGKPSPHIIFFFIHYYKTICSQIEGEKYQIRQEFIFLSSSPESESATENGKSHLHVSKKTEQTQHQKEININSQFLDQEMSKNMKNYLQLARQKSKTR